MKNIKEWKTRQREKTETNIKEIKDRIKQELYQINRKPD